VKIYVSSTYRDLQQHRTAIDRTLRRMGHDVIGMEQYVAESARPVDRCIRDVTAADVVVLVLAWRYGYVPTEDNPGERSVTEIEYQHAVEEGKPILAFLLDPEAPWPPNAMDSASADQHAAANIGRLRSEVGRDHLAGIFTTPEELAGQVAAAVAVQGLTTQLSEKVLNRTSVDAGDMGGFGTGSTMYDTSVHEIKEMVVRAGKDRALVVNLGDGDQWWSTRLFLLASLLRSLTQVRQIVFCGRGGRFAGMASPDAVLDGFGARFPILERFGRHLREAEGSQDRDRETERQIAAWFDVLAMGDPATEPPVGAPPPAGRARPRPADRRAGGAPTPWDRAQAAAERERELQVGVREELLHDWLGERLISRCVEVTDGGLTMAQVQQIVDCLVPDVPVEIQAPDGRRLKVIDRDAFGLELAREWVRAGLPRNPAR
jgi:hypothetical protein